MESRMQQDISAIPAWTAGGLCICGNCGCLETRFSSPAIESDYFAHLHRGAQTQLSLDHNRNPPTVEAIYRAAADGDPSAQCVITRATQYLAAALVSFVNIFDPEVIILGGNVVAAGDQLFAPLRTEVAERTRPMLGERCADHSTECYWLRWCCRSCCSCLPATTAAEDLKLQFCRRAGRIMLPTKRSR